MATDDLSLLVCRFAWSDATEWILAEGSLLGLQGNHVSTGRTFSFLTSGVSTFFFFLACCRNLCSEEPLGLLGRLAGEQKRVRVTNKHILVTRFSWGILNSFYYNSQKHVLDTFQTRISESVLIFKCSLCHILRCPFLPFFSNKQLFVLKFPNGCILWYIAFLRKTKCFFWPC